MRLSLDDLLLEHAQSASERVQADTGLTCFWLARLCHVIAFGSIASVSLRIPAAAHAMTGALLCWAGMYSFMVWGWYAQLERYYAEGPDVAHWITLLWRSNAVVRYVNLALMAGMAVWAVTRPDGYFTMKLVFSASLAFWTAAQYFQCCTPSRPRTSRLRAWLDSQVSNPHPVTAPSPV